MSFASSHAGRAPFDTVALPYGPQVLWPTHCVQGTAGAELAADLDLPRAELVIRKGFHPDVDSYSAFTEADRRTPTGLAGYLRERGLGRVFLAGLATDFCVAWSALEREPLGSRQSSSRMPAEASTRMARWPGRGVTRAWRCGTCRTSRTSTTRCWSGPR